MLVLVTFRPEFTPPWPGQAHMLSLQLTRLAQHQITAMVERVAGKALPDEVVQQLLANSDGVPLYIEEMTKNLLESGLLTETDEQYELTGPLPEMAISSSLQDSFAARLDRRAPVRELAQIGAVLGRDFTYDLIRAMSQMADPKLQDGLGQLSAAEILFQRGVPPDANYTFKHALLQDAAYESLLKSQPKQFHAQTAKVLEQQLPETKETHPELVAHHYTEASLAEQAIPYWQQAGERAMQRSANQEAIGHLTQGLAVLQTLPDTPERSQRELTLQITLGAPLIATKGYAAAEVGEVYRRARELCGQLGDSPQLFPVLNGLWAFYFIGAQLQTARELAEQLLSLAYDAPDSALVETHWALGCTLHVLGELQSSRTHLEQSLALYDFEQHRALALVYGHDPAMSSLALGSFGLWLLGYPDQAVQRSDEAVALARKLAHPYSLSFTLHWAAFDHLVRGEVQATQERVEEVLALSREQEFPLFLAMGTCCWGWVLAARGQMDAGMIQIPQGLSALQATGTELFRPDYHSFLAEAHQKAGQTEAGLSAAAEALTAADRTGERWYEAELYRLKGELTLKKLQVESHRSQVEEEAEECFQQAIEIAQKQEAKSWELRATMSLARLWQQQGKKEEANDLLAPVYAWFTEGFDTKDLLEAETLLKELG